jgi:hypothetical protein
VDVDVIEEPQRFEAASLVTLFGSVLLLVSPFLTWFEPGGSGWTVFELLDLLLVACALYVGATATMRLLDVDRGSDRRGVPLAGGLAFAATLFSMLEPPPVALDASLGFGAWLALLGALIILAAGLLDLARVSVTVNIGGRAEDDAAAVAPREPMTWAPPAPDERVAEPRPAFGPAPTAAPPSRSPSLLRPSDPPSPPEQVPEGD